MTGFKRVAHLRPFRLPGGEVAIDEPWRVAASLLVESIGPREAQRLLDERKFCGSEVTSAVVLVAQNRRLSPQSTSLGRLFDGVAALVLGLADAGYEGQLPSLLESLVDDSVEEGYAWVVDDTKPRQLDWRPMILELLGDMGQGCPPAVLAARFHRGLARGIAEMCGRFPGPVVLSGGVFQNRVLTEWVLEELGPAREVGRHSRIPPGDGGLAAGQLAVALARLMSDDEASSPQKSGGA